MPQDVRMLTYSSALTLMTIIAKDLLETFIMVMWFIMIKTKTKMKLS